MKSVQSTSIPHCRHSLAFLCLTALPLLLIQACGMAGTDDPPLLSPESSESPASSPKRIKIPTAAANEIIVECERHIRAWETARADVKTNLDRDTLQALEMAFGSYVMKELSAISDIAITGPERSRSIASTSLGFTRNPTVLPILLNNLSDSSDQVVANTLYGLAMLGDPNIPIGNLQSILQRSSASSGLVRNAAFAMLRLAQIRSNSEPPLPPSEDWNNTMMALLDRHEPNIRAQGATGLGYLKASNALFRLADLLSGDPESRVRFAAAFALGELRSMDAAPNLIDALQDPDGLTSGAARAALTKIFGEDFGPEPQAWELLLR
jgi:hypothetical protein